MILSARLAKEKAIAIEDVYSTALWGVVGGIIGARLFHVIDKWFLRHSTAKCMMAQEVQSPPFRAIHVAEFASKLSAKLDIPLINQYNSEFGRGVRVVNGTALEKRCCRKATVGSNPTLSAMIN